MNSPLRLTASTGSSTTPWARSGFRPRPCGARRPSGPWRTSRSFRGLDRNQIRAMALLKSACAQVNKDLGKLPAEKADAIMAAAGEIADGQHDDQFPIDVFQTGSGTSSNMNANEVIASICARNGVTVHPNDDVNMSQSSNDTFPTSTHIAATEAAVPVDSGTRGAAQVTGRKAALWRTVVKSGRTHLMDAVPVTLGQEFGGYARQIEAGIERVRACLPDSANWPLAVRLSAPDSTRPTDSAPRWSMSSWSRPAWPN